MTGRPLRTLISSSIALMLAAIVFLPALGEGTETLGPPAIPIATGTTIVGGGVGLVDAQPDTMTVNVPAGATIKQVILYWEGQSIVPDPGDSTIVVNGITIPGTLIGGLTAFQHERMTQISAFRADITNSD
jgi:hypothetical protein